jgi:hypothetical protein
MRQFRERRRKSHPTQTEFFITVTQELTAHPRKLDLVRSNIAYYQSQSYLKAGFLKALERMEWVFEANLSCDEICQQILADDYIGNRIRRYPLIFKGVLPNCNEQV